MASRSAAARPRSFDKASFTSSKRPSLEPRKELIWGRSSSGAGGAAVPTGPGAPKGPEALKLHDTRPDSEISKEESRV